jgi:hypothetical protein
MGIGHSSWRPKGATNARHGTPDKLKPRVSPVPPPGPPVSAGRAVPALTPGAAAV